MRKSNKYAATIRPSIATEEARWRAEQDLRVLKDAEAVKCDPARMKAVRAIIEKETQALKDVAFEVSGADKD